MSDGTRQRPWWSRLFQHAATDAALEGAAEAIRRAAVGAAQDRSLDVVRDFRSPRLSWYERPPWYTNQLGRSVIPEPPTTLLREAPSHAFKGMQGKAYGLRAFANPLTRLVGKSLSHTIGGVPVAGTAIEMLHSSPLADGTLRAAGREMLNRYRTGRDPFAGYTNLTDHDRRRATAFMLQGYNPLRPATADGRTAIYAGDLRPGQGLSDPARQVMVFDPEYVHLSPEIVPAGRSRPWTAAASPGLSQILGSGR